jgi:Tol biopolymer transport system component
LTLELSAPPFDPRLVKPVTFNLLETDPVGTGVRRIRENVPSSAAPSWSPEGDRIVFADWGKTTDERKLVVAKPDGSMLAQVTTGEYLDVFPAWSPDGTLIAYVHCRTKDDKRSDLVIYDVARGTGRVVTRGTIVHGEDSRPAWGPSAGHAAE